MKIIFYKEGPYKKKITPGVRDALTSEIGRVPSKMEVVNRVEDMINARDAMLLSSGVMIIILTVLFGKI
ncbi:hypothetical protein [Halobacteriovorax sp.]|uniref:hypothetical protein n=1 Tax=Halobacteriovorax sp. TaxID=2020862 RepID=UPI003564B61E